MCGEQGSEIKLKISVDRLEGSVGESAEVLVFNC